MVSHQLRKFAFFNKELIKDSNGEKWSALQGVNVTCTASGRGKILIGDSQGRLHFISQDMTVETKELYETQITHVALIPKVKQNLVVTVGEDERAHPLLRVWNAEPHRPLDLVRYVDLTTLQKGEPGGAVVTCIALSDNLSNMAVGMADGTVWLWYRHDITRDQRYKELHSDKAAITGLAFNKEVNLFVATEIAVYCYKKLTDSKPVCVFLSEVGAPPGLSLLTDHHMYHQFLIAPKNEYLFFMPDSKGRHLPNDGVRSHIAWYRGCLVSVSQPRHTLKQDSVCELTIYDMNNNFYGFKDSSFPQVRALLSEWGSLFVLVRGNEMYKLNEKGIQEKIKFLTKKCLYDDAIQLAKNNQHDYMNLIRAHGDHLATKGEHDSAISKYIATIGHVEPSYVIRKFLDSRRIHNLTQYLEALHERDVANRDHTTLLLNCYTKLKNVAKLERFVRGEGKLNFDVETAIKVCRQATYFDEAAYLAKKFEQYDWFVHIQVEDRGDYEAALDYIKQLGMDKKKTNIKSYGRQLMEHLPEQMTAFLTALCCDGEEGCPDPEEFIPLFLNKNSRLIEFLEAVIAAQPKTASQQVYNTLLELYLREGTGRVDAVVEMLEADTANYDPDHALMLLQLYRLQIGIVTLCEKRGLYGHVMDCYMEEGNHQGIIDLCYRRGQADSSLWITALKYFAAKEDPVSREHVATILNHIEQKNLLPPLMVVKTLSECPTTPVSVLMGYITRHLSAEEEQSGECEKLVKKYSTEAERMSESITRLKSEPIIFQTNKCTQCTKKLSLPAVHLLCKHSWHQMCFEELTDLEDQDCPVCVVENKQTLEHLRSLEHIENLDQQFFRSVEHAPDPFTAVADFFAKGVYTGVYTRPVVDPSSGPSQNRPRRPVLPSQETRERSRAVSRTSVTSREVPVAPSPAREPIIFDNSPPAAPPQLERDLVEFPDSPPSTGARITPIPRVPSSGTLPRVASSGTLPRVPSSGALARGGGATAGTRGVAPSSNSGTLSRGTGTMPPSSTLSRGTGTMPRVSSASSLHRAPSAATRAAPVEQAPFNPFDSTEGEPTAAINPFASPGSEAAAGNPFSDAEDTVSNNNPFAGEDEGLNPFGDDDEDTNPFPAD